MRYLLSAFLVMAVPAAANDPSIIVQSTTSTQNSGLYDAILPEFTDLTGIGVRIVAVGTGQAIKNASNCDGDLLLVHAKATEEQFVADGYGTQRFDVMYNDFVLVGPASDPARISQATVIDEALRNIARSQLTFVSRGDDSGTHMKERDLWTATGIDPAGASGTWYRETGSGMGATLNIAVGMNAYTMTDRATWLAFENRANHTILFEGDAQLFNQYGITAVSPANCPKAKLRDAQTFIDWILGDGQSSIAAYKRGGEQLFFPNAD